jgi:hypothetical protein
MSFTPKAGKSERETTESLFKALDAICRLVMWVGLVATVIAFGFLLFYVILFSTSDPKLDMNQVRGFIEMFRKVLTAGMLAFFIGSAVAYWGEAWMEGVQIVTAVLFFLSPTIVPMILPNAASKEGAMLALLGIRAAAMGAGIVAVGVVLIDLFIKVQTRFQQGTKADQLKYGKGIKEEADRKNKFMGRCWELPFCRKFVRERCPIYHARRTCWREKVGCMCEEEVIKGAMENRAIPKDMVAAARYIPRNNKLSMMQKMERCRQCVIYNEHQKHKYRLFLPVTLVAFAGICAVLWGPLVNAMHGIVNGVEAMIVKLSVGALPNAAIPDSLQQIMLACLCLIVLSFLLKLLEFLIFKLKI